MTGRRGRRRRAWVLTLVLGLEAGLLIRLVVRSFDPDAEPFEALGFLFLGVALIYTLPLTRWAWRAVGPRPEVKQAAVDQPPPRHTGLSGEITPPTRW